ncbi:phosphotransferase [Ligilactobacillus equi]|uniref:CTP:phosphocholine cytidylyltransferase/choline kinase n=1 Tax=Ligilactobacillus equi DPC 6820 TaxID=1392007 RepID=V7I009_9LACO|nr:phosphotransferase [Ligilactobacillus equi]ETA74616.1 CTP:phosphocholine cytidylyltransferase/choline kinase [Ligilactobacillus equi DPC 6820]
MNEKEKMILRYLVNHEQEKITQRELAQKLSLSLGTANEILHKLKSQGYLTRDLDIIREKIPFSKPKRAIILAAGYGMRMVPLNMEFPKGVIEVKGETLIERLIKQLQAVGITDITVIVGFMKEKYEYLIDMYNVKLKVNRYYTERKNLYSLALACQEADLTDSYIIPCDIYAKNNPFSEYELNSWYMVSQDQVYNTDVILNRKLHLKKVKNGQLGNRMVGIAYLNQSDGQLLTDRLKDYVQQVRYNDEYWESILEDKQEYVIAGRLVSSDEVIEINTYEELRDFDNNSNQLNNELINLIADVLKVNRNQIEQIELLKKGMTNRSFKFICQDKRYIMRIPGEGTGELINRQKEAQVYQVIAQHQIGENVCYINPNNGYKLTEFIENTCSCDSRKQTDLEICMGLLRNFHQLNLKVDFEFDLFGMVEFYEKLRQRSSNYRDYTEIKRRVLQLKDYIDVVKKEYVLCHIDANEDNFLLKPDGSAFLIDWEYAAMQDPDVDIAMFAIYSMYNRQQLDNVIDTYYQGQCDRETRLKIYAYVAVCGLLWSNWCEYKNSLGVDFGEYSLMQYRYAKEYSKLVLDILEEK